MFSADVVCTDKFLEMPASSQALYLQLGMKADDDGFVSAPKQITRMTNASEDDFRILVSKGYAEDTSDLHNINKKLIRKHLKEQEVPYQEFNIGYDATNNSTQHTFTTTVYYYG